VSTLWASRLALGAAVACGGETTVDPGGSCAELAGGLTARLAKSPRPNAAAEILAIETSKELVAPDALYERVAAELAAIAEIEPVTATIAPLSPCGYNALRVDFDQAGWASVAQGTYHAWDCHNRAYGVTDIVAAPSAGASSVVLTFGKRINLGLLAKEYASLPQVTDAERVLPTTDGPDVCLEVQVDQHYYVFDQAAGGCETGCLENTYFGFRVAPGAAVTKLGTYDPSLPGEAPAWYGLLSDCRTRLNGIGGP